MDHLQSNYAIFLKEKGIKPNKQAKIRTLLKPLIQKIIYVLKERPMNLNLAKNERIQIIFVRKIKPMKWE